MHYLKAIVESIDTTVDLWNKKEIKNLFLQCSSPPFFGSTNCFPYSMVVHGPFRPQCRKLDNIKEKTISDK